MSLRSLFTRIESTIFLNPNPQTQIKRLLESYNSIDWEEKVKHQKIWFDNPIIHNGIEIEKAIDHLKTPVFFNESKYFDMYIIGFPPNYSTNIHSHTNKDCYFKNCHFFELVLMTVSLIDIFVFLFSDSTASIFLY